MNVVARVKAIITSPRSEWRAIVHESGDPSYLFTHYVAKLALIPALAQFIGFSLIGHYVPFVPALVGAVFAYILTFILVYLIAIVVDVLARRFDGERDFGNALKLVIYSFTPSWLAGVFLLVPALAFLSVLGLYGIYLMWIGLPVLMRVPRRRAPLCLAAIVTVAVVLSLVAGLIQFALFGMPHRL